MALIDSVRSPEAGWLRNRKFDLVLICGLTAVALAAGGLIAMAPATIGLIMLIDTWVLGSPHVIATLFRLAPDKTGLQQHRFLIFGLPLIVLAVTAGIALGVGIFLVATIYFYWQWYHTLRQSWGVAQLYRRRSPVPVRDHPLFAERLFVLVALWGLLHRLTTAPEYFLFPSLPIAVPYVPEWLADGVGVLAVAGLAWWVVARLREWLRGELPVAHTLFSASHFVIFIVGYVVMDDVAGGWLVTNIWHSSQYLMLVWMFNQNALDKNLTPQGWFFKSTRGNRVLPYLALCIAAAFPIYAAIQGAFFWGPIGVMVAIVANQTLNFHHFIVDAVIWRAKRKPAGAPA
jgi:hypothetical protein